MYIVVVSVFVHCTTFCSQPHQNTIFNSLRNIKCHCSSFSRSLCFFIFFVCASLYLSDFSHFLLWLMWFLLFSWHAQWKIAGWYAWHKAPYPKNKPLNVTPWIFQGCVLCVHKHIHLSFDLDLIFIFIFHAFGFHCSCVVLLWLCECKASNDRNYMAWINW